ncbi:MAG: hypothetical protein ACQEXJ_19280 [Myxococcota bacterium]
MEPFTRRIAPVERLWIAVDGVWPPFVNQLVMEAEPGQGALDREAWKEAVAIASAANPGARLVVRGPWGRRRWVDSGTTPPVRVADGSAWDAGSPEGAPFLLDPLPPFGGPTCEVLLVHGDVPRVVFRTHHAVMDGRGTMIWVEDVFRALRGQAPVGARSTVTDLALARDLGGSHPGWQKEDCLAPTGEADGLRGGVTWRRVKVPGRFSRLLPRIADTLARSARAHRAADDGEEADVRFSIPVDLRPRLTEDAPRSTANLTGMIDVTAPDDSSVVSLSDEIRGQIGDGRDLDSVVASSVLGRVPLWLMRVVGDRGTAKLHRRRRYGATAVLSNLGRLPLDRYRGAGFQAATGFFIPPGTETTACFMAMGGGPDHTDIAVTMPEVLASDGRLDRLVADVVRALEAGRVPTEVASERATG